VASLVGCQPRFETIGAQELRERWGRSRVDSAVSWWYLGQEGGYEHFVEKRPLEVRRMRVRSSEIDLDEGMRREFTEDPEEWVNLEMEDLHFVE
jgi:hypothetical protein